MLRIALCELRDSRTLVMEKAAAALGGGGRITVCEYASFEGLCASSERYDMYFLNQGLFPQANKLMDLLDASGESQAPRFVTFVASPISEYDLEQTIIYIRRHMEHEKLHVSVEFLTNKGLRKIPLANIRYFEYADRRVRIKGAKSECFCTLPLNRIYDKVRSHGFLQPHKAFIVNTEHIVSIKNYTIYMNDGSEIPLSQKRSKEFRRGYRETVECRV